MNEEDLRDCFAMFAMNGLLPDFKGVYEPTVAERVANLSYQVADAMMVARSKKPDVVEGGIAAVVKQWDEPFVEDKPKRTYTRRNK